MAIGTLQVTVSRCKCIKQIYTNPLNTLQRLFRVVDPNDKKVGKDIFYYDKISTNLKSDAYKYMCFIQKFKDGSVSANTFANMRQCYLTNLGVGSSDLYCFNCNQLLFTAHEDMELFYIYVFSTDVVTDFIKYLKVIYPEYKNINLMNLKRKSNDR